MWNYDLIITLGFDIEDIEDFDYYVLEQHRTGVAVSKSSALAKRGVVSFADFCKESFIVINKEESPRAYWDFISECTRFGFKPSIVREAYTLESQLLCVEFGLGGALIDRATRLENSQNVCIVDLEKPNLVDVVLAWNKYAMDSNRYIRTVLESLENS